MARREDLYSYNDIRNLSEDWILDERNGKPYSGESVQRFIKTYCQKSVDNEQTKMGAVYFDTAVMKLYTFRTEQDRDDFILNGDESLILSSQDVVFGGTQKKLSIINKMNSNNLYFTTNNSVAEITVGFESKEKDYTAQEWTDVIEDAYFTVSVDKGATGNYVKILEDVLVRYGETLTFDVFKYISSGVNRVRVTAYGAVSEQTASYGFSVNLTSMYLSPANFGWYVPFIEGSAYNLGGVNIGGALSKKLIIRISNDGGYSEQYEENIGTATYITNPYYYTKLPFPTAGTGVYEVEMWLDADGLESDHLRYSIMCVATADVSSAQLCCFNNVAGQAVNYSENVLFDYAVYNGGSATASPHVNLTAQVGSESSVLVDETLSGVDTAKAISYSYDIELESELTDISLSAVMTYGNTQSASYLLDNSASFPATSGASFYLNSATRNNTQDNRMSIVNEITKDAISAVWTNMAWVDGTDGWTVDNDGRKCLLMPARTKVDMALQPLLSVGNGKTIEFTFKVSNASDYEESVVTVCDTPASPKFRGIRIRPNNILAHSRDLNTDDANQSYGIPEDTLINVQVSIIRNYKTNYGNICIIYVNGVRKKEFAFTNADSWITDAHVILGSDTADLYLYNMRVYEKGFGTQDALQNFIASLSNSVDKRKAYELMHSVIDDSFKVDYEKTKAVANVVTVEMLNGAEMPHYGLSKEYTAQCNLETSYSEHPDWNWGIENITIEGQGTTSMNYFRWNLRWRLDKSEGFTVHLPDGSTSTEDTLWFDGEGNHPKLSRMTAKINYASSMQSHKIGATGMFNDVHHHLGLDNEAGGRVAVFQHPFYFFEKKKVEGTEDQYIYEFIGLFTFGADKGDKYTFGYKDESIKDTLLVLEGLDHPIKGVGMDYPWSEMKYVADEESLCVDKGNNNYDAGWEVSQSGSAETEEEIQAKLDAEFKPAYEVAYNNSTMIIGTDETLGTINADVDAWGQRTDENGNAYQRYEFWIDGEYELYYLSKKTNQYEKNGVNLLTQLGLSAEDLSGLDIKAKNELFKQKRREKFKAEMGDYWHLDDCLYCYCFLLLVGATDNFKKNSYPYKMGTLASGSRWRWRQDDLDTLFDIDNQGLAVKGYSIEAHDWTDASKTAYVFKGEDSVFWTLLGECFDTEAKAMGKKILGAMYEMSSTGSNTIDRLMGFFQEYYWNNAQNYFAKSAYNSDAEYKYEEAWPKYASGEYDVDVHPLAQSLGDHLEAEMLWVRQRLIYMMSKWGYGPFAQYTDSSLGRINFRTQLAQAFKLTPFMDLYPCILSGQGAVHASQERVPAGEEATITGAGGTNTNVYIMAADELESIGDLSALTVDAASNAGISIASKRLRTIKVGDEVAENVTSNLQQLSIGQCNSLESIDARNLKSLTGTVDLTRCPRLIEALFGGTDVRSVTLANGSKIVKLQLSEATTVLELLNLGKLETLEYTDLSKLEFFRVENCGQIAPFEKLKSIYQTDGNMLRDIRVIGFDYNGASEDIDMLANLAEDKDKDGQPHSYNGIDSSGIPNAELLPVIEGSVTVAGNAYEDAVDKVKSYFPNLSLTVNGDLYFRFADAEVNKIMSNAYGDATGVTLEKIESLTTFKWGLFNDNTLIEYFDELEKFVGVTRFESQLFAGCTNLKHVTFPPNVETFGIETFNGCTSLNIDLAELNKLTNLTAIFPSMFRKCRSLTGDIHLTNITTIHQMAFEYCSGLTGSVNLPNLEQFSSNCNGAFAESGISKIESLGRLVEIKGNSYGQFQECTNLKEVTLPETLEIIGQNAFNGCTSMTTVNLPQSLKSIGSDAFKRCRNALPPEINLPNLETLNFTFDSSTAIRRVVSLGKITSIPGRAFYKCTNLEEVDDLGNISILSNSGYYDGVFTGCSNLTTVVLPDGLTEIKNYCFSGCGKLSNINIPESVTTINDCAFLNSSLAGMMIRLPNLNGILGATAFRATDIVKIEDLGQITEIGKECFRDCKSLLSAILPASLTKLGDSVFYGSTNLTTVVCKAVTPPTIGGSVFAYTKAELIIYVPDDSVEAYKTATNWSAYADKIHPISEYVE